jgi:hypothetical protein
LDAGPDPHRVKSWIKISVGDPEPEKSETFGWIRSGTEINVSDQDSNPDLNPEPKLYQKKIGKNALFSG